MEIFSTEFFSALAAIIVIDLVLAGDNAIVIALASRRLPPPLRRRAIVWGTIGAIAVRTALTMVVVWLLKIPGLLAIGGVLLVWIAYKLLADGKDEEEKHIDPSQSFWAAMKTIIVADALMGLDNVLAVAGAAQGSFLLVVLGLLISIPIMIWGSHIILKYVARYPVIVYIGAGVLAWTSVKMVTSEPLLAWLFEPYPALVLTTYLAVIGGVLGAGFMINHRAIGARVTEHIVDFVDLPADHAAPAALAGGAAPAMKVLLPVDGSPNSMKAVRYVVHRRLSRSDGAEVHLLHVRGRLPPYITRFLRRGEHESFDRDEAAKALAPARELLRRYNVPHVDHIATGDRVAAINTTAERLGVSEIVIGTARKNSLTRILQDSVSHKVLESARVPVRIVVGDTTSPIERFGVPAGIGALIAALLVVTE